MTSFKAATARFAIILLIVAIVTNLSLANTFTTGETITPDAKSVVIKIAEVTAETTLKIADLEGYVFHTETLAKGTDFSKRYNLKNLPNGNYTLAIEDQVSKSEQMITIENDVVSVVRIDNFIKPLMTVNENKVIITSYATASQNYFVTIADDKGAEVFIDETTQVGTFAKSYELSQLPVGDYTISVFVDQKTYTQAFTK